MPRNNRRVGVWMANLVLMGLFATLIPIGGFAQTRCPVGIQPGNIRCLPDVEEQAAPRPAGRWIKTWGALAFNDQRDMGFSSGMVSKEEAEEEAVYQCERWGQGSCQAESFFFNQCVAVFHTSSNAGAMATAPTKSKAMKLAKGKCERDTGEVCEITIADCSLPIFEPYR